MRPQTHLQPFFPKKIPKRSMTVLPIPLIKLLFSTYLAVLVCKSCNDSSVAMNSSCFVAFVFFCSKTKVHHCKLHTSHGCSSPFMSCTSATMQPWSVFIYANVALRWWVGRLSLLRIPEQWIIAADCLPLGEWKGRKG